MLKVIILEDNKDQAKRIESLVNKQQMINRTPHSYDMEVALVTGNPKQLLDFLKEDDYLAILDVELGENQSNGIDVAEQIRKVASFAEIIFISAYQQYLPYTVSRRVEPFDYIDKGMEITRLRARLRDDIDEAYARYQASLASHNADKTYITYEIGHGSRRKIPLSELYYIESIKYASRRIRIVGKNIRIECHGELKSIQNNNLLQVSQSAIVNPMTIREFDQENRQIYFDINHKISLLVSYRRMRDLIKMLKK